MYEPSRHIATFNIAGFQHWDGAPVIDQLKLGSPLQLVAAPDNPHDSEAVAIRWQGTKLGYVPSGKNHLPSLLLHYGHTGVLECRVLKVDPSESPWKQVMVGLYLTDARDA